jgi:hypothetical protein
MSSATTTPAGVDLRPFTTESEPRVTVQHGGETAVLPAPTIQARRPDEPEPLPFDQFYRHSDKVRETFLPITKTALIDRLTHADAWAPGQAKDARRFFQYLDYWRRQCYSAGLREVDRLYEAFNPDSDLLTTRAYSQTERVGMQVHVVEHLQSLLKQANYVQVKRDEIEVLTKGTYYGLDLQVDLDDFDELLVYYRGRSTKTEQRRDPRKFYRKIEFELPIFRRLFVLFKVKPAEQRVQELMHAHKLARKEAERRVKKLRARLPAQVKSDNIYMKLFKNMPRADIEMIFPNTRVNFRMLDKLKLGLTGGAGLGMGVFGAAGKIALVASNPFAAIGAMAGLGGIAARQGANFLNQRQKYMIVMAQNLYFHAMADNRSAMIKLADRAAEEDFKEEMLLYCVIAKATVHRSQLEDVDQAIERYLKTTFDLDIDFDLMEALGRLLADGVVTESPDGFLAALPPREAALHIDAKWDVFLDNLVEDDTSVGVEIDD